MGCAHRLVLARTARTLWTVVHGGESLSTLVEGRHLGTHLACLTGTRGSLFLFCLRVVPVTVVEQKDRLTRFGFKYIETLLAVQGRSLEVVNLAENPREDLIADLVSIIYSFSSRLSGQRRVKRKTEQIVKERELQAQKEQADDKNSSVWQGNTSAS